MTENQSLHELIRMIGNGDPTAFDALYARMCQPLYKKLMWKYKYSLTKEDAEDIAQNTFMKIRLYASRYTGLHTEASAKSWIYKIAFSEAIKIIKMSKRLSNSIDDDGDGYQSERTAVAGGSRSRFGLIQEGRRSVEERAEISISIKEISSSVQYLTVEEQKMLTMRYEEELTFEEIGQAIGRTKPRAKQIIDELIRKIRKAIGVDTSLS
ncbi:MAG: sigma-70 family RNA polymerase sigma factor [Chloroflexi bacterium]|nr:sigma-70 family RNA polymerase sigma factor [Chloroflexota bacterium]